MLHKLSYTCIRVCMYPPVQHNSDHYENIVGVAKRHRQCRYLVQTASFLHVLPSDKTQLFVEYSHAMQL